MMQHSEFPFGLGMAQAEPKQTSVTAPLSGAVRGLKEEKKRALPFPLKLYDMLEEAEANNYTDIISWLPEGISFRVHKPKEFLEQIMPRHFEQTKFKSFQRQRKFPLAFRTIFDSLAISTHATFCLYGCSSIARSCFTVNLWGFQTTRKQLKKSFPPSELERKKGGCFSYYHENFLRGSRSLCVKMKRTKVKGPSRRGGSSGITTKRKGIANNNFAAATEPPLHQSATESRACHDFMLFDDETLSSVLPDFFYGSESSSYKTTMDSSLFLLDGNQFGEHDPRDFSKETRSVVSSMYPLS